MPSDGKRDRAVSADVESALNAYGFVGAWENDLHADRVYLSGSLIELMGIAPENAVCGVPLSVFLTGIHPDDRERVAELAHKAHVSLGRFAAQFRSALAKTGRAFRMASASFPSLPVAHAFHALRRSTRSGLSAV